MKTTKNLLTQLLNFFFSFFFLWIALKKNQQFEPMVQSFRASPSGVPNAKYLAFDTPNTKNKPSWGVLNAKKIWDVLQYNLIFGMVRMKMTFGFYFYFFHLSFFSQIKYPFIYTFSHTFIASLPHILYFFILLVF